MDKDMTIRYIYGTKYRCAHSEVIQNKDGRIMEFTCYEPFRAKIGVAVLKKTDEGYVVGWSICSDEDTFEKSKGIEVALSRAKGTEPCGLDNITDKGIKSKIIRAIYNLKADYVIESENK